MDTRLNRLQLIQNHAARAITRTQNFDHISGVLKKKKNQNKSPLVTNQARIDHKVLLLVFVTDSVDIYHHIYQPDDHKELCVPCALVYIVVCSLTSMVAAPDGVSCSVASVKV